MSGGLNGIILFVVRSENDKMVLPHDCLLYRIY